MTIPKFISFSGGVESTTMCILYGKDAKAIFADGKSEHKKMYQRLSIVEDEIKKYTQILKLLRCSERKSIRGLFIIAWKSWQ